MEHDVEGATVSDPFDNELESRPGIVDEIRATMRALQRLQGVQGEGFADAVLRGLGQVVFQNNALSGLLILLALSVNSFVYAVAALFGAVVSTYTAMLLRVDRQPGQGRPVRLQRRVDRRRCRGLHQQGIRARRPAERST